MHILIVHMKTFGRAVLSAANALRITVAAQSIVAGTAHLQTDKHGASGKWLTRCQKKGVR